MKLNNKDGTEFIVIGENVHTTRVVLRRGKRVVEDGDTVSVRFTTVDGDERLLEVPGDAKKSQDYEEGRIKHVMIAVNAAMSADADRVEAGMQYLRQLVHNQVVAGADFLDINVDEISWRHEDQKAAMAWLVAAVQGMTDVPVAVDSSDVSVIESGLAAYDKSGARPMLNSASLERIDALELAKQHNAKVVVTAAGEKGMPDGPAQRIENASRMIDTALGQGFIADDVFVDPLYFPISVDTTFGHHGLDAIKGLRAKYPEVHITGGVSNVSFGIPGRRLINDVFLRLAIDVGLDSGIIDPVVSPPLKLYDLDSEAEAYTLAEDVLLDRDRHCKTYLKAWRRGGLKEMVAAL